jgi:hypothetical protein
VAVAPGVPIPLFVTPVLLPSGVAWVADAVMSAVLSTGLPCTAHTVPSSAYRRAVT